MILAVLGRERESRDASSSFASPSLHRARADCHASLSDIDDHAAH